MQDIDELCARIEADVQELLLSGDPNADPPPDEEPPPALRARAVATADHNVPTHRLRAPPAARPGGPSVPTGRVMVGVHHRLLLHRMVTA